MKEQFFFALSVTGPILVILILGVFFRRIKLIDDHFISIGNKLVFNVTLPCILFFGTATRPLNESLDVPLVVFGAVATVLIVVCLWWLAPFFVKDDKKGVFIQGAFRGNMGIIGIAMVLNAYGPEILPKISVYLGILTILYNILSVWVLHSNEQSYVTTLFKNPLIIAVVSGLVCSGFGIPIPAFVQDTGNYFSKMTLPLALVCIGGSLRWESFRVNQQDVVWPTVFKLVLIPVAATGAAIAFGFRGQDLGLLFLMMSAPTAVASYVMARQMTQYGEMAAAIVAMTTTINAFTVTAGLVVLQSNGYI